MDISKTFKNNSEQNLASKTEGSQRRSRGERRRRRRRRSESVFDLEAEETKGFMDLGFVFTEEDLNSELLEILPGLRTLLCKEEQRKTESSMVPRPYLSEAWDYHSGRTEKNPMVIDLRMAKSCGEINMKNSLKLWARSVASTLK